MGSAARHCLSMSAFRSTGGVEWMGGHNVENASASRKIQSEDRKLRLGTLVHLSVLARCFRNCAPHQRETFDKMPVTRSNARGRLRTIVKKACVNQYDLGKHKSRRPSLVSKKLLWLGPCTGICLCPYNEGREVVRQRSIDLW